MVSIGIDQSGTAILSSGGTSSANLVPGGTLISAESSKIAVDSSCWIAVN